MKKRGWGYVLIFASLYALGGAVGSQDRSNTKVQKLAYAQEHVLIKLKKQATEYEDRYHQFALEATYGLQKIKDFTFIRVHLYRTSLNVPELLRELETNPVVEYAEPDFIVSIDQFTPNVVPNDPYFSNLWGLHNTGQTGGTPGADIRAAEAWGYHTGSGNVVVGVIDTGVDYNHPDLQPNMWTNPGEIPGNGIDDDGDGYVDDVYGINAITNSGNPFDDNSHGTHVSGTIAGKGNNGVGVAGVCWTAKIMALKFLDSSGVGYDSDAIPCIQYAIAKGAHILSNSWGGGGYSQSLKDAIDAAKNAGILFVAAAGNAGTNNDLTPQYPASYDCDNIIAVAATDLNDLLAPWSCYGLHSVDVAAPGVNIFSTLPNNGYGSKSGTSMATPHVSGLAALLKSYYWNSAADSGITAIGWQKIKNRILSYADAKSSLQGKILTGGRINALAALTGGEITSYALSIQSSPSNTAITVTPVDLNGNGIGTTPFSRVYAQYTTVSLTAPATNGGFSFQSWKLDGSDYSSSPTISVKTDFNHTLLAYYTQPVSLPFSENFNGQSIPNGWSQQGEGSGIVDSWSLSSTSYAGGSPNEIMSTYQSVNPGTTRLIMPPINTVGFSTLNLSFRHFLDTYSPGGDTLKIQTSPNGTTWTNEAWSVTTGSSNIGPELVNTTITHNLNAAQTFVAFVVTGNLWNYDYWYVDNVSIFSNAVSLPTVTTTAASGITSTSALTGGNVASSGGAAVTERGVCVGLSPNPTTSGAHTHDGSGTGAFASLLTGCAPGTSYHIRAYAANSAGTGYGADQTFTTLTGPVINPPKNDFNGDGREDILWRNVSTGENYLWYLGPSGADLAGSQTIDARKMFQDAAPARVQENGGILFSGTPAFVYGDPREGADPKDRALRPGSQVGGLGKPPVLFSSSPFEREAAILGLIRIGGASVPSMIDFNWQLVGTGDFNQDGRPDILWRNSMTGENGVWYMNGGTRLGTEYMPSVTDLNWQIVGAADFSGDGKPDVLWRNAATGENYIWYMNGAAKIGGAAPPTVTDANWRIVGTGDFSGDGKPDILWRNAATGENYIWYMDGGARIGGDTPPAVTDLNWQIGGAGDFDGDGKMDILWRNYLTGENGVWYMNGGTQLGAEYLPSVPDLNWKIVNR